MPLFSSKFLNIFLASHSFSTVKFSISFISFTYFTSFSAWYQVYIILKSI